MGQLQNHRRHSAYAKKHAERKGGHAQFGIAYSAVEGIKNKRKAQKKQGKNVMADSAAVPIAVAELPISKADNSSLRAKATE
jgi:hypothetical protein